MKRPAICFGLCLSVSCLSLVGWAGVGNAKAAKSGGAAPAPAADPNAASADPNAAPADPNAAPADPNAAPADPNAAPADQNAPGAETVTPEGDETGLALTPEAKKAPTTLSWQDIVVVPRKAFLKGGRVELAPLAGVSINDNLIRHYAFGGTISFFLSDVMSIGVEGQYYVNALTGSEENVGLQYNRIPTLNKYLYAGALDFSYVPVYGKFAWFNKQILHWEISASAGGGITVSEIIPRNAGDSGWKNYLFTPNAGIGSRFFLLNWLTVNFALRDYIIPDKFEPANRMPGQTLAQVQANADTAWVNNLMLYAGVGLYLPTKFSYKTPR